MAVKNRHILLVCIEFVQPLFSGNGILTQNIVRGLLKQGCKVTVICAMPAGEYYNENETSCVEKEEGGGDDGGGNEDPLEGGDDSTRTSTRTSLTSDPYMDDHAGLNVLTIQVPKEYWKRLDRESCWEIMAREAPSMIMEQEEQLHSSLTDVSFCFAIDWSALPTIYNLQDHVPSLSSVKLLYFVFRVFTASKELCRSKADFNFYLDHELSGLKRADSIVLLSHVDQRSMLGQMKKYPNDCDLDCHYAEIFSKMQILVPPLRQDIQNQARLAMKMIDTYSDANPNQEHNRDYNYILCNTRLSPEKNALRFAQVIRALSANGTLERLNITPLMIGSICDKDYAQNVYDLLPPNSVIVNRFLGPSELGSYLQQTVLNVHPSVYDAYGMTIAEAAAFGVPSILHHESIGATSLLREDHEEVLLGNMSSEDDAIETVKNILISYGTERLKKVGENARLRAMSWGVADYISTLCSTLDDLESASE